MRADAKPNSVIRAMAKAIEAKFDRGNWLELGLITDTDDTIKRHRRLLRSLEWGDPDYSGNVLAIVPTVLGDREKLEPTGRRTAQERFANLHEVEEYVGLQAWLADNDRRLHDELYAGEDAAVLDQLQAAARELGVPDVAEHAVRIRRGLHDDPAQAVGASKELLETVLKRILGLHGTGRETKLDIPKLVKKANIALGLDPAGIRKRRPGGGSPPPATGFPHQDREHHSRGQERWVWHGTRRQPRAGSRCRHSAPRRRRCRGGRDVLHRGARHDRTDSGGAELLG